jgi:TIR domain
VADIFISYSKKDHEEARLLAAYLEAEGYSVWWDTSLKSGEQFRKVIMTELGRARATVVIWTENSVESDWVQSEAGRAHADRKLIPVKSKALQYKDIPPPFDNMHTENIDRRENILGAVVAQLAKPEAQVSALGQISKKARYHVLSWLGIAGAAVTLASNLQGIVSLARLTRRVFESWAEIFQAAWSQVLFFLPKVYGTDAMLLTLFSFALMNMALCLRKQSEKTVSRAAMLKALVPALAVLAILTIGMLRFDDMEQRDEAYGYFYRAVRYVASDLIAFVNGLPGGVFRIAAGVVYMVIFFLVIPLAPIVLAYATVRFSTSLRLDWNALASRLWRIVGLIAILLALNYLSLWLEQQAWLDQLVK